MINRKLNFDVDYYFLFDGIYDIFTYGLPHQLNLYVVY